MLTDSYGQGVPYPTLLDKPNAQSLGQGIVENMVPRANMRFPSASVRGATLLSPQAGMVTYLADTKLVQYYDGTSWRTLVSATLPWANVSLAAGYSAWGGSTVGPRVRREGSIVYLEGRLKRTDGTPIGVASEVTLGTIPAAYAPVGHYAEGTVALTNSGVGAPVGRIEIWHDTGDAGARRIQLFTDKPTTFVGFSSWWFVN